MASRRTVDLLPEIFRTGANRQFLGATLDQLTQEPSIKRTQGFVGRRVGPGVNPADFYVTEPTKTRQDYQLEPGIVFFKPDTNTAIDAITYPGMIDALNVNGADTTRQDRLWQEEYYAWDPFIDLDKFVNYSQYYWLAQGPDSVDVSKVIYPTTDSWDVTRVADNGISAYQFSDVTGNNPSLTLVRGGNYTFNLNQLGHKFWIQAAPGINGTMPGTPNISSRDVLGVINNGEDLGTVTFNVPLKTAQDFYYTLNNIGTVDLVSTDIQFVQINNVYVDQFLAQFPQGVDGITNLDNRTIIFTNDINDPQDGGWQVTTQFDPLVRTRPQQVGQSISYDVTGQNYDIQPYNTITDIVVSGEPDPLDGFPGSYDSTTFDQVTDLTVAQRYSIWRIQYIYDGGTRPFMRLSPITEVANLSKFSINFGTKWSNTSWYKNASGYFEEIPLLTAALDTLWYQDSTNPDIFGRLLLIDNSETEPLNIDDIIGAKDYTSPNGVVFTNGLKVQFRGLVEPAQFQNLEYYVEGVGTGPGIDSRVGFVDGEAYYGAFHTINGQKRTGLADAGTFAQNIYDSVAESLANIGVGGPANAPLPSTGLPTTALGNGIRLIPVSDMVTPETYTKSISVPYDSTPYDTEPYDEALDAPEVKDYITINRSSGDRNAWSRSNRWFHRDVIQATAIYNNQTPVLDNALRGKRPIIEFRENLRLYNFGTQGKRPVNIVDTSETDAFSDINGTTAYSFDGYNFIQGSLVIFANDLDDQVRNKIYQVNFIDPNNSGTEIIDLEEIPNGTALEGQTVVSLSGVTQQGISWWFDGSDWVQSQQKTNVNQAPLFDVFDSNGISLGNLTTYPSSTFEGSKLFGYALGDTQILDEELGFALKFATISNVGDILFTNYFYDDTFLYVENNVSTTIDISVGTPRQYIDRVSFSSLLGWQTAAAPARSRQVFRFTYDGTPLVLDVAVAQNFPFAPLQIFQGTNFVDPTNYTYQVNGNTTTVTFTNGVDIGTIIEVQVVADQASQVAYYQVPLNLENNPFNENSDSFTLGSIRQHYQGICQNLKNISGPIDGPNNSRDLGDILRYGDNIVQHSSPLALAGPFLRDRQWEVIQAIQFNSREYEKYKARLLDAATRGNYINTTPTAVLDQVITEITLGRNDISPFYWSDMLPWGQTYVENTYIFSPISTNVFDTQYLYDFTSSNFQGLSVYFNGTLLQRNTQYTVGVDVKTVTLLVNLSIGDNITIREYQATYGSFVPNTPTKMGLFPAYQPEKFLDESYADPTLVIRGHDGSITRAFGDYRDDVLLEFENRIYNNLKIVSPVPLTMDEIIPGQFRATDYTLNEVNQILSIDFLNWVAWNRLEYTGQLYDQNDAFSYNYSQSSNKLNRQPLLGAWRGIYNYFYDTIYPNTRPWEMLGFSERPDWWEAYYGPAPYTSGNLVLWEDLALGLVRDPAGEYIRPEYARPDLLSVIPAGSEGELLPPLDSVVGNYSSTSFRRSWVFGDDGPTESTWRTSSAYPYAIMRLMVLTRPAEFFSLFADRDLYVFNDAFGQFLWDDRYRLDASRLAPIYGNGTSKASYINWIIDYNRQLGTNGTERLETVLDNIGVKLCWRLAGFSDKKLLKIFTERSTPNSLNTSLLLPDESYQILLYKNQPYQRTSYSAVIIQRVDDGYQVFGYNPTQPYFSIQASLPNGNVRTIEAGGTTARVLIDHSDTVVRVPYGYVFTNLNAVCDFLVSYGVYLERAGYTFATRENGYIMDWPQMAQEFLYWSNQGWAAGSLINLNPSAVKVEYNVPGSVIDSLADPRPENLVLNQNRIAIRPENLVFERLDNSLSITSLTQDTISLVDLRATAYESLVILDNVSVFADLIYQPVTGARQYRVRAAGIISGDWNGSVNAPGWVINQDNIAEWQPNQTYTKGQIVLFKNEYWSASTIIQPADRFDYTLWIKSDYDQIQKGLLPNAPNSSDQLQRAYDTFTGNLENEVNLFSYGLIGFRPRQYMTDLDLDDASQVQLYQQFLGTKGTLQALEQLSQIRLDKEVAQYDIFEQWAILRSQYGATANRNYFEIVLNQSLLQANPSLVQIIQPQQPSRADQTVLLRNLWKTSERFNTTELMPTRFVVESESSLPSAGYVNLEDVNYTVFDIQDFASTATTLDADIDSLGVGDYIWAAKVNAYDWDVFRVDNVPGQVIEVSDNLDGRSLVTMNRQHGLAVNDYVIIRFFDTAVNGTYQVLSVPSLNTFTIALAFLGRQTTITGEGLALTLDSARVAQATDIIDLPYAKDLAPNSRAWVDNNGLGLWEVLEKRDPFTDAGILYRETPQTPSRFGAAITQGFRNLAAMVGAPGYLDDTGLAAVGAVYTYVRTAFVNNYVFNTLIVPETPDTLGFGSSMDMGDQTWAAVGAPQSYYNQGYVFVIYNPVTGNAFQQTQLLLEDPGTSTLSSEFGYSVAMSRDERWLYVGAPGDNRVYCYGRQDVQLQSVRYPIEDSSLPDSSIQYNWSDHIVVSDPGTQMAVLLDETLLVDGVDYSIDGDDVILQIPVDNGQVLTLARKISDSQLGNGVDVAFSLAELYLATDIYSVSVFVDAVLQRPFIDYNIVGDSVVFNFIPTNGAELIFTTNAHWTLVETIAPGGFGGTERFGHSVTTSTDGSKVLIGCPNEDNDKGRVYVYDRCVQKFQVVNAATTSYTTTRSLSSPGGPINVAVNGQYLLPSADNIGGQFSISGDTVTISAPLAVGDFITVGSNQFTLEQILEDAVTQEGAQYGQDLDQCVNDCSLYVGAPHFSGSRPQMGHVDYKINQSRVYGTTISTIANPTLTSGQTIRINDEFVSLTQPPAWTAALLYNTGDIVINGTDLFQARRGVQIGSAITDTRLWRPVNWPAQIAKNINTSLIPNVSVTLTGDVEIIATGLTSEYSIGTLYSSVDTYTPLIYVNNVLQVLGSDYTYDNDTGVVTFAYIPLTNSVINAVGSRIELSTTNSLAATATDKLTVSPGTGTLFADIGWQTFVDVQTIDPPVPQDYAHFGGTVFISDSSTELVVGAPQADAILATTFDSDTTVFDDRSCTFSDTFNDTGAVYTFDYLPSANPSLNNPGKFVFGQELSTNELITLDQYGSAINYTTGTLLIGAPGEDLGDSDANFGQVYAYNNLERKPTWTVIRQQTPVVDIAMLNSVFMYDRVTSGSKQYFDFFDPLQGRLLGAVQQNIDFISPTDPAAYNVGDINNYGQRWAQDRVGQMWLDTTNVRWLDVNQDDIVYASRRWGQIFPGSTVDVYEWISSSVPPALYAGPGTIKSATSYAVTSSVNQQGVFGTTYFFWVKGQRTVNRNAGKTLSSETCTRYIQDPRSSGIAYVAPVNASTVAIYNGLPYISVQDTVLHVEYDEVKNDAPVHVEYQLISQNRPESFLTPLLFRKLLDSFCGKDTVGNPVPDPLLSPSELYGVAFRPRQSMFVNRFLALENYLVSANAVMARFPIAEIRRFPILDSQEPEPSAASGEWDKRVADYTELTYQDLTVVPIGYKYLVVTDSTNDGLWTIYEVVSGTLLGSKELALVRVQTWNTRLYWNYVDWYAAGYNSLGTIATEVQNFADLSQLDLPQGSAVRVVGGAKWEIYQLTDSEWIRVGLQDGTIAISPEIWDYAIGRFGFDVEVFDAQYFDQEPVIETRQILTSLNEEIFIDDLAIERNRLLMLMFNFIMQEQEAPLWLTKTSLIEVDHIIRDLLPFQIYRRDNQDFVQDYITEVKPYHVQYSQFNLIYKANDQYDGTVTDFDLPAYFDTAEQMFISPVLDDDTENPLSTTSSVPSTSEIWQTIPWSQWFQHYTLAISAVTIARGGSGYTIPPEVIFGTPWLPNTAFSAGQQVFYGKNLYTVTVPGTTGNVEPRFTSGSRINGTLTLAWAGTPASGLATIGGGGTVNSVIITSPGSGYILTPIITLDGGNGSGAIAYPVMVGTGIGRDYTIVTEDATDLYYNLVRSFSTTMRFDRCEYSSTVEQWQSGVSYLDGALVRYDDRVWQANSSDSSAVETDTFNPSDWILVPAADLNGADRTMGYYVPTANEPGLDLALLITGVDYPGVQVQGTNFTQVDPAILDAIYESEFTDTFLGVLPAPAYNGAPPDAPDSLVVSGGAFVDTYESHAPEELVPGIIFDTLDFRVYTAPGADWAGDGHGFDIKNNAWIFDPALPAHSWSGLVEYPVSVSVYNTSIGIQLDLNVDYTVDYVARTVTIINGASSGQVLQATVYGLGGGNQLYKNNYIGDTVNAGIVIPLANNIIYDFAVFVNGQALTSGYSWDPYSPSANWSITASYPQNTIVKSGSTYYRSIQAVVPGVDITDSAYWQVYAPPYTLLELTNTYTASDFISVTALGTTTPQVTWSTPVTQYIVADGVTLSYTLTNSLQGTNPANIIVEKNGIRARPAEGIEYISDGSSTSFDLPNRGGYSLALVADNEVDVYIDGQALTYGTQFVLDPVDGDYRTVTVLIPITVGSSVLISVNHAADYTLSANTLLWKSSSPLVPILGDVLSFTTFNDTSEQDILTQVFQGPTTSGVQISQGYDSTDFDPATINNTPGSFDYSAGSVVQTNVFDTGRAIGDPGRLTVSLNGFYLFYGNDFLVEGSSVVLPGAPIGAADVLSITSFTQDITPDAEAFRIFQDMRGTQLTYRITPASTTVLVADLSATADVIYVADASHLSEPNLGENIFGQITINGERITYRARDTIANTVSGLRRGVTGTGAASHVVGSEVYDIGLGNLLPAEYQDRIVASTVLANGSQTIFVADDISVSGLDSTELVEAVQVYVGGLLQTTGYTVTGDSPVSIAFAVAPQAGVEVSIRVRRGLSWYQPGPTTPSNGVALQVTDTLAAVFIRGE